MNISKIVGVKVGNLELDVKNLANIEILDNGVLHYLLNYDAGVELILTEHFYSGDFEITCELIKAKYVETEEQRLEKMGIRIRNDTK